ncbi:MAG: tetratricopeptide repeat protein [Pirellulaceae bacterium]|nr:tetratricopeptide repeat protein [Pirellulaceae bacterium]
MSNVEDLLQQAIEHHQVGHFDAADSLYRRILEADPNHARTLHLMGVLASQQGNFQDSVRMIEQAIRLAPNEVAFHSNLGLILTEHNLLDQAVASLLRAIAIHPGFADAHNNLGNVRQKQGQFEAAIACYRKAISINPDFAIAHFNLGVVLGSQGLYVAAIESYQTSLAVSPDAVEVYNNLGVALMECRRYGEAILAFQSALRLSPNYADAFKNLGNTLTEVFEWEKAIEAYRQANRLRPGIAESLQVYLQQHICDWNGLEALTHQLIAMVDDARYAESGMTISPFSFLCLPIATTAQQQIQCSRAWSKAKYGSIHKWRKLPACDREDASGKLTPRAKVNTERSSGSGKKIRVGYLSADFYDHPTAYLSVELFEAHDRERFEVIGYSIGPSEPDPMRERLTRAFDKFYDLQSHSFDDAASKIAADRIDILVDMKGYTRYSRPEILAYRPATIQVSYLGYPGTMGADFIDYAIVDEIVVPRHQQSCFSEQLVYLPGCYQVNSRLTTEKLPIPSRADCNLPETGFVFCSFNNSYKITPKIFDVWMRLLQKTPESCLWLLEANRFAAVHLGREAEERGVSASRIVFAPKLDHLGHLARHRVADLFLDCYPVNAHTSGSDALRMGLPLLTLQGDTFVSRVASSLLTALELPELIATTLETYEAIALQLAQDRDKLRELQMRLSKNIEATSLFDGRVFARTIEVAYQTMWEVFEKA